MTSTGSNHLSKNHQEDTYWRTIDWTSTGGSTIAPFTREPFTGISTKESSTRHLFLGLLSEGSSTGHQLEDLQLKID